MGYVKAFALLIIVLTIIAALVGGGMLIVTIGAAIGAATVVGFGICAVVRVVWEFCTSAFRR